MDLEKLSGNEMSSIPSFPKSLLAMHYVMQDGKVVPAESMEQWMNFMSSNERWVLKTYQVDKVRQEPFVSTVFLGLDHGSSGFMSPHVANPLIFETCVFGCKDGDLYYPSEVVGRYRTMEDAIAGHQEACERFLGGKECLTMKTEDIITTDLLELTGEWQNSQVESFL